MVEVRRHLGRTGSTTVAAQDQAFSTNYFKEKNLTEKLLTT